MAEKKQFLLRIDKKLFNALEQWSADDLRSINSHIEYILREAVNKSGRGNLIKEDKDFSKDS